MTLEQYEYYIAKTNLAISARDEQIRMERDRKRNQDEIDFQKKVERVTALTQSEKERIWEIVKNRTKHMKDKLKLSDDLYYTVCIDTAIQVLEEEKNDCKKNRDKHNGVF